MKNKDLLLIAVVAYTIIKINENNNLREDNKKLNKNISKLLSSNIKKSQKLNELKSTSNSVPKDIKQKINLLIKEFETIDNDVYKELISALILINNNQYSKAISSLTKIIENMLKQIYGFKNNFAQLINSAKSNMLFDLKEYNFVMGLKAMRNEEAHELNVNHSELNTSGLLLSLSIINKLKRHF